MKLKEDTPLLVTDLFNDLKENMSFGEACEKYRWRISRQRIIACLKSGQKWKGLRFDLA